MKAIARHGRTVVRDEKLLVWWQIGASETGLATLPSPRGALVHEQVASFDKLLGREQPFVFERRLGQHGRQVLAHAVEQTLHRRVCVCVSILINHLFRPRDQTSCHT